MKKIAIVGLVTTLFGCATLLHAAMPEMPKPVKEHKWLQRFVGEWKSDLKMYMEPGKPPLTAKCTESYRKLGGFWVVGETKGKMMGQSFEGLLTLGYDPAKKYFVGSWTDSGTSYLWRYTGALNGTGRILTLNTEGPCPMKPGKLSKFKEIIEFHSNNHRTFKSMLQGDDGKWTTMMTIDSRRQKSR